MTATPEQREEAALHRAIADVPASPSFTGLEELSAASARTGRDLVADMISGHLPGVHVRGALGHDDLEHLLTGLRSTPADLFQPTPWGRTFPRTLIGSDLSRQDWSASSAGAEYFAWASAFRQQASAHFGFDAVRALIDPVTALAGGRPWEVAASPDAAASYGPVNFRVMEPGALGIQTHVGNEFMFTAHECAHLAQLVHTQTQLSWFYVLQPPEGGGELVLYDLRWEETPPAFVRDAGYSRIPFVRDRVLAQTRATMTVRPAAGDLVVFDGGRIWHSVAGVHGARPRITVGGFFAPRREEATLLFWS